MSSPVSKYPRRSPPTGVTFSRFELAQLLNLYSRRVISGEWRDYAIDHGAGEAVFSIFRHSADRPLFAVSKVAQPGRDRRTWVVRRGPEKLRQGDSIVDVLPALEGGPRLVRLES